MSCFERSDSLQQALLHGPAYAHDFSRSLHLGRERIVRIREFVEGKSGHFGNHVVQSRLEGSRCIGYLYLIQRHAHTYLGRYPRYGISAGFGRQGRRSRHPRIYLDQIVSERLRIQSELHITASLYLQSPYDLQGTVTQHVVLFIGQSLRRTYHDGVTGVYPYGIQILHVADSDGCIIAVPHHLILYFLISSDTLLYKHFAHR